MFNPVRNAARVAGIVLPMVGALCGLPAAGARGQSTAPLMRFPTIHGDTVAFVADGNLWSVPRTGGVARRLTSDPGETWMPRFSPDGRFIAFTARRGGNEDVYVIPAAGGPARRLTFHSDVVARPPERWGPDNLVLTWTPDGTGIVFLSRAESWNPSTIRPFVVPLGGGLPRPLPIDTSGLLTYGPDGHSIATTRTYRDFRTWKRYDGGRAADVYTFDLDTKALHRITDFVGTDTDPMWHGNTIYFLSDRDAHRRANVWAYDTTANTFHAVTRFTDVDVDFPSLGPDGIVFDEHGDLYVLDLPSETLHRLAVTVPDDGTRIAPRVVDARATLRDADVANVPDADLAPNGKRAAFSARGDIFTVPASDGPTRDITRTSGADEDHPAWSPDGTAIAYVTDGSGDSEIATRPARGGAERLVTHGSNGTMFSPVWSPDGRSIAYSDSAHRLFVVDAGGGAAPRLIASDPFAEIHDQNWSPDARYLAYSLERRDGQSGIAITEVASGHTVIVSPPDENDSLPAFSRDGRLLAFVSARHVNPTLSGSELDWATIAQDGVYVATLAHGAPSPFAPKDDEGAVAPPPPNNRAPWSPHATAPVAIDFDGLAARAVPLPIPPADIDALAFRGARLFYHATPPALVTGELPGIAHALRVYDLDTRKDEVVARDVDDPVVSADGSKVLVKHDDDWLVLDARPGALHGNDGRLDFSGLRVTIDPRAEWREMFDESWRLERDFFFSTAFNGVDWRHVHDLYAPLIARAGSREDVNWVIGSVQGELGNSHTYVDGGDTGDPTPPAPTPLLGVDWGLDPGAVHYKFARIYRGDNSRPAYRAPLAAPGLDVADGDLLIAVDGVELRAPADPFAAFSGKRGPLTLTVARGEAAPRRDIVVEPVASELNLREKSWIDANRAVVDHLSNGRVGYVYLSDMEERGAEQFVRQFYPALDKQGLIIDDRWNAGGYIDQAVLERLRRVLVGMDTNRERIAVPFFPSQVNGPKACLLNHESASDGDLFPWYFRAYGLGPLIGTRSWGGVRGIRGEWKLVDGGTITTPDDAFYDGQGWLIENHGVDPDITVDDTPGELAAGHDRQLETAVSNVLGRLGTRVPEPPPPPLLPPYGPGVH